MQDLIEKAAEGLNLDRSDWKLVKFGDVAIQQKRTVDRENTELTRYVKGEHMYSEDIHLREWGELKDEYLGPAFIRKFEEGDILYGSRRTYLRKVVVAPFEGITSNTTFVIKANEEFIDKRLLPYLMLSEGFSQHSIRNSKGSVNPYVNWKDLACYEFLMPPKEQQSEICELLWAMDKLIEKKTVSARLTVASKNAIFKEGLSGTDFDTVTVEEIAAADKHSCVGGPFGSDLSGKHYVECPGVPVIRGTNLTIGGEDFIDDGFVFVSEEKADELIRNMAYPGDIIVTQRGTLGQVGLIPKNAKFDRYVVSQSQMKLKVDSEKALSKYVYYYLCSFEAQHEISVATISTGIPHINLGIFKKLKIKLPSLNEQEKIVARMETVGMNLDLQSKAILASKNLHKSLINQVF